MSKDFGTVQKKIISYLENKGVSSTKEFKFIFPEHKENSIYRAIQLMTPNEDNPNNNILIPPREKVLWRRENSESTMWELNKKHPRYMKYKQKND